jgi:DNA (cytosine-5)-methyltransferase 1
MSKIKYFSMFSGIGGFELGIKNSWLARKRECDSCTSRRQEKVNSERGGISQTDRDMHNSVCESCAQSNPQCVGYSEIDKYAIKVYERQFKHENYGDATNINPQNLPDFDLLVGGFPCQAFSVAGKRGGFNDTRGTLFFDIARILAEKRPRHLLLENVKGLLSHDSGKTFQTILGVLSDLGYRVEWQVLNSKDFGVPQNRERVFIIGHLGGECGRKVFPIIGNAGEAVQELTQGVAQSQRIYDQNGVSPTLSTMQGGGLEPKVGVTITGVDRKNQEFQAKETQTSGTLTQTMYKGINAQGRTGVKEARAVLTPDRVEKRQNGRRFKEDGEPSFTLTGQDRHGVMESYMTTPPEEKINRTVRSGGSSSLIRS